MPDSCCCEKAKESCISCDYCNSLVYCSDDCKAMGWSIHQDECNVHTTDEPNLTIFYKENVETAELEATDPMFQSHIIRTVNPKGIISERLVESHIKFSTRNKPWANDIMMGAGEKVKQASDDNYYSLKITVNNNDSVMVNGLLPVFMHTDNHLADDLAHVRKKKDGRVVLWAPNSIVRDTSFNDIDSKGRISAQLFLGGVATEMSVVGDYRITSFDRKFKKLNKQQKKEHSVKFARKTTNTLLDMAAKSPTGEKFKFTLEFSGNHAKIIDMEFYALKDDVLNAESNNFSRSLESAGVEMPFKCDATDIDHITGLIMALEDKMASGALSGELINSQFEIISNHRLNLESGENDAVTPKINAAVHGATTALWEEIGKSLNYYKDKLTRAGSDSPSTALQLAEVLQGKREKAGNSKFFSSARKGALNKDLKKLREAIDDMLNINPDLDFKDALNAIKEARKPIIKTK